jgi:threonine aldolase
VTELGRRGFASDNNATVHPEVLAALARANVGHAGGYGHDRFTERARELFLDHFGQSARTFLVFNGTGANVLCMRAACRPWEAVLCTDTAHVNVDECGAPEAIAGVKLLAAHGRDGKLTPETMEALIGRVGDEHAVQPRMVSISQATELGTVYSVEELRALVSAAHGRGLVVHVDGARLSNAAAALDVPLRAITTDVGVDLLSFGGTKNGLLGGEAVVLLNPALAEGFEYIRKQSMQLASKMRYLAVQFEALLGDGLWHHCAAHANAMAAALAEALADVPGVTITRPVQANAVFATLAPEVAAALQERFAFYTWDEATGEVRWMCSWDTTEEDVEHFAAAVREALAHA